MVVADIPVGVAVDESGTGALGGAVIGVLEADIAERVLPAVVRRKCPETFMMSTRYRGTVPTSVTPIQVQERTRRGNDERSPARRAHVVAPSAKRRLQGTDPGVV